MGNGNGDRTILISGATGQVGSELVRALSRRGAAFRAMVRPSELERARRMLGDVELAPANFDDPESIARALAGAEQAFLLTPSSERAEEQQRRFVDLARRQGVRKIVKLSQYAADAGSPVRFLRYHAAVERAIRDSAIAFTFLRPNLFMQGLLGFRETIAASGAFFAAAGDAPVSAIDVRDIAEVAAAALLETRHDGVTYDLTGPEALTHAQMAAELASALGRPVAFVDVPPEAMREALSRAGLPDWQADGLIEDYAHYRRGEAAAVSPAVEAVTGVPPRSFATFARDHAAAFA
jgi:uncharacterized protein YbjT (DUF2867 family)